MEGCLSATPQRDALGCCFLGLGLQELMISTWQRLMAMVAFGVVKLGTVTSCTAVTQLSNICVHTKSELLLS